MCYYFRMYNFPPKSEFLVAGGVLLFLVTKYWFKQSKMPRYKEKIVVPDIPQRAGNCTNKLTNFRGGGCPGSLECSALRPAVPSATPTFSFPPQSKTTLDPPLGW